MITITSAVPSSYNLQLHPGPLLVPAPVITEVCQVLESRCGPVIEAAFLDSLRSGALTVVELIDEDYGRMAELVRQYADLPLGAADASVVAVAERFKTTEIATLDHRHFLVVKPRHIKAFTLLPG